MVMLSKLFKNNLEKGMPCNDIIHSGSCSMNAILNSYKFLISNMKYFAPVVGLPLFAHIRSLNREVLKSSLKYYIEAVVSGTATGWTIMLMICLLRHVFGKFSEFTIFFLPTFIGSYAKWIVPSPRVHRLFETSVFQCTLESFIIQQKTAITKLIARSTMLRTFIFMSCSGLILNAKRAKVYKGFWLMESAPYRENPVAEIDELTEASSDRLPNNNSCNHRNKTCIRYAMQGVTNHMIIGLTLDFIKIFMNRVTLDGKGFMVKLLAKLRTFRIRSCALLTSYVAVYRLSHCYFNRNNGGDSTLNHTAAAFVSGLSFIFYAELTLLCYALVLAIQISWQHFKAHLTAGRRRDTFEWMKRLSYNKILYPLALAYLVNTYCCRKQYVSSLSEKILNAITNNYARTISLNVKNFEQQPVSYSRISYETL